MAQPLPLAVGHPRATGGITADWLARKNFGIVVMAARGPDSQAGIQSGRNLPKQTGKTGDSRAGPLAVVPQTAGRPGKREESERRVAPSLSPSPIQCRSHSPDRPPK